MVFAEAIRQKRLLQVYCLHHIASKLDVYTSIKSKIKKSDKQIQREQIAVLAEILKAGKEELLILWLSDQLYNVIKGKPMADEA